MKRKLFFFLQFMIVIMGCKKSNSAISVVAVPDYISAGNTVYYVSNSLGNDANNGISASSPWKTLSKINHGTFASGDQILLRSGDQWIGETLNLKGSGSASNPIKLSSYNTGAMPKITPNIKDEACIKILNYAGWKISNLELSGAKDGIRAEYDQVYNKDFLWIENCYIHDIDNDYNSQPTLYNHFSSGVVINGYAPSGAGRLIALTNFTLKNCTFNNCNTGFNAMGTIFSHCNSSGFTTGDLVQLQNITIQNCVVTNGSQWGMSLVSCSTGNVSGVKTDFIGNGINTYGTAALVAGYSQNLVFDSCNITHTYRGPQNYDGCGFDFEGGLAPDGTNQHDITLQNSTIDFTDGAGIFVFNNGTVGRESKNCKIDNVKVGNFGVNVGNTKGGITFIAGTTGTVTNCVFTRSVAANPYLEGDYSGFIMNNNSYN